MTSGGQLNVFGVDLTYLYARAELGVQQLIWGDEAGLYGWLGDPVETRAVEEIEADAEALQIDEEDLLAVLVPADQCLISRFQLPAEAEVFLAEAVANHVYEKSPFTSDDVVWGYIVNDRIDCALQVSVAILSRSSASGIVSRISEAVRPRKAAIELWAKDGDMHVPIFDFSCDLRRAKYFKKLRSLVLSVLLGAAGTLLLLAVPTVWLTQTATQYDDLLVDTQRRVAPVVEMREQMMSLQDKKRVAAEYFAGTQHYAPWLHKLASLTPDSAHLNRLSLQARTLTISGMADNAADYQATLASAGVFAELRAPSAFTRDRRSNRERFTLSMTLQAEAFQ